MTSIRDQLRSKILASTDIKSKEVVFFGGKIELRQPRLADILEAQNSEDRESAVIDTLIRYAYVPDTDEKVFEEGDAETLKGKPFGADFLRVSKALEELTEVNFLDSGSSSEGGQTST